MFLRSSTRKKNGKSHRYWSRMALSLRLPGAQPNGPKGIVENRRVAGGRVLQRHVPKALSPPNGLYLGEIDGSQQEAWQKTIEIFEDGQPLPKTVAPPFRQAQGLAETEPAECPEPAEGLPDQEFDAAGLKGEHPPDNQHIVRIRLSEMELRRPRQWGACWLACHLYEQLELDTFFAERLPPSRKGTRWDLVLQTLCTYRLIDPGSEWRLPRRLARPPTPASAGRHKGTPGNPPLRVIQAKGDRVL